MLPSQCFGAAHGHAESTISTGDLDLRLQQLGDWLSDESDVDVSSLRPASADASFRRYFRADGPDGTVIVMDAPPPNEDCRPFVAVAGYLERMGLNAPRVLSEDVERGFLLLTDLGDRLYLDHVDTGRDTLYRDAVDALLQIRRRGEDYRAQLPPYDRELLSFEMSLFHDWLCEQHLGIGWGGEDEAAWNTLTGLLIETALSQPRVFVHRDYHSRNLMVTRAANPGIIDFQDAMNGPLTYDLVSLLKDCYVKWPASFIDAMARRYFDGLDGTRDDWDRFRRDFDLTGVQRHLKAAGIFARLNLRDGKPGYLKDIPRTLSYIVDLRGRYGELDWLTGFIETRVLPALEAHR